jgi:hypothetical protein
MDNFFDDPLGLDPLSPLPTRDPRWFVPAHGAGNYRTANLSAPIPALCEAFPTWRRAQPEADRLAAEPRLRRAS